MNILGIEFDDKADMKEVCLELSKRGINPSEVPYHFLKSRQKARQDFESNQMLAQELIDECDIELNYMDFR